jgi:hypothetical protein
LYVEHSIKQKWNRSTCDTVAKEGVCLS